MRISITSSITKRNANDLIPSKSHGIPNSVRMTYQFSQTNVITCILEGALMILACFLKLQTCPSICSRNFHPWRIMLGSSHLFSVLIRLSRPKYWTNKCNVCLFKAGAIFQIYTASRAILLARPAEPYPKTLTKSLSHYFAKKLLLLEPLTSAKSLTEGFETFTYSRWGWRLELESLG